MSNSNKKGFTLIELLVVISIISLLSSIVLASLADARNKAKATKIVQEVRQFQIAMEAYRTANGSYPPMTAYASQAYGVPVQNPADMNIFIAALDPYIKMNNLSFTKTPLLYLNLITINYIDNYTCGGGVYSKNGYDVLFQSDIKLVSFSTFSGFSNYYCFTNI